MVDICIGNIETFVFHSRNTGSIKSCGNGVMRGLCKAPVSMSGLQQIKHIMYVLKDARLNVPISFPGKLLVWFIGHYEAMVNQWYVLCNRYEW